MITDTASQTPTADTVKVQAPDLTTLTPRRVRLLTIEHTQILIPDDISDAALATFIALLDRSTKVESSYYHTNTYSLYKLGPIESSLSNRISTIYPDAATAKAASLKGGEL